MTRFARAKGSKSSNERAPEDSTPWEVMKEQLLQAKKENEESKKREEAEKQRVENYEKFLKEHKSQKRKAVWCDFPETEGIKNNTVQTEKVFESESPKKKKKKQKNSNRTLAAPENSIESTSPTKSVSKKSQKNKNQNSEVALCSDNISFKEPTTEQSNISSDLIQKKKKKNKKPNASEIPETQQHCETQSQVLKENKKNKNKKNKKLNVDLEKNVSNVQDQAKNISGKQNTTNDNNPNHNNKQKKNKKAKKLVDGVPARRKPIDDRSFQLIINGKEVELVRFDGFPIMKRDAERLDELKKNMINKGIPKSEVNKTLKLERRRAEKALARLKRDVCYNCRKGGHNLSDCPELKTKIPGVGAPDGVCFKCGSTEHRQFECKVQRDNEFRFASCFICREPGHIARQCPDNPKGLYPNGGGCKLCGDVTHLRKDCPTTMDKREETSIKLQTLDSTDNLEGIDQKINTVPQETAKKPKKIQF